MTKVKGHFLRALEEDRHEHLPSPTYVKGFLSAYAKALRIPSHDVLIRYARIINVEPAPAPPETPALPHKGRSGSEFFWEGRQIGIVIGVMAISLLISYHLHPYLAGPPIKSSSEQEMVQETIPSPPPGPAEVLSPESEKQFITIVLRAIEETWVQIRIDGQLKGEVLLKPGEKSSFQASDRIELWIGNGGGLDILFNGNLIERCGTSGEVVRVMFTQQGMEKKQRGGESRHEENKGGKEFNASISR